MVVYVQSNQRIIAFKLEWGPRAPHVPSINFIVAGLRKVQEFQRSRTWTRVAEAVGSKFAWLGNAGIYSAIYLQPRLLMSIGRPSTLSTNLWQYEFSSQAQILAPSHGFMILNQKYQAQRTLLNVMWQPGWKGSLGRIGGLVTKSCLTLWLHRL